MNTKVNEGKLISGKDALIALANGDNVESKKIGLVERADRCFINVGAWRTEEEIKQVVAALRQVFGGNHDN